MATETVSLRLQLTGNAGPELARIAQQQRRDTRSINDMQKLGLRTQRQVRDEIRNQERAYRRLKSSATATNNDIRRAQRAMRAEVKRLNDELRTSDRLTKRISGGFSKAGALAGGAAAAGAVVNSQIQPARSYDERLSYLTLTAADRTDGFAEKDAIKQEFKNIIKTAARNGGSRDGAAAAAEALIASGKYDLQTVGQALNSTTQTAFAAGADPQEVAQTTIAMKNFGIAADNVADSMNAVYLGGKLGSFEVKDQAKWLPSQLSSAKTAGFNGVEGVQRVVAMNQVAMRVAGSTDEAGNYVKNFLDKLASKDFADAIAKNIAPQAGDPTKGKGKFDWQAYMLEQRSKGVMAADAFVQLIDREMQNNAKYQQLKNQAVDPNNPAEAQANMQAMLSLLEGTAISNILTDREARSGAVALSKYNGDYKGMVQEMGAGGNVINNDAAWLAQQEHATAQQRQNEQLNINHKLYKQVNDQLSGFNKAMGGFMQNHEGLATAAYGAGVALAGLAAFGTVGSLLGGGGAGGLLKGGGRILGRVGGLAGRGAMAAGGAVASTTGMAVAGSAAVGYGIGTIANKTLIEGTSFGDAIGEKVAQALALMGNDEAQAALEANQKYEQMIAEQQQTKQKQEQMVSEQQQTKQIQTQMLGQLQAIANKPPPTFNPNITIAGQPLAMNMMNEVKKQSKRGKFGPYA